MEPLLKFNEIILDAVNMSSDQSATFDISEIKNFAIHSVFTGAPSGSLKLYGSNDETMGYVLLDTYNVVAAGSTILNVSNANYAFIKFEYDRTAGTGTLTSRISGKN